MKSLTTSRSTWPEIEVARKSQVLFRITGELAVPAPGVHLTLLPALIKFDRFEVIVEKCTELGANVISPFEAARTEYGLAKAAQKRHVRWERIALEASQQSRRVHLPQIGTPQLYAQAIKTEANCKLFLDEGMQGATVPAHFKLLTPCTHRHRPRRTVDWARRRLDRGGAATSHGGWMDAVFARQNNPSR